MRGDEGVSYGQLMTTQPPTTTLDHETVDRLSSGFHRCFSDFEADDNLFADEAFFDLPPPLWRFQRQGPGEAFTASCGPSQPAGRD